MPTSLDDSKSPSILLVASEASSCMYAQRIISLWNEKLPGWKFFGIGDREMQRAGMECLGLAEDLAVVGLVEVLTHWKPIKKTFLQICDEAEARRPLFALLLDYPGFNLRLAKKLKAMGIPVVYFISPQVWAWKQKRVFTIKENVDEMLVVFPFEVEFYKKFGVEAHFVGHPLVEVVDAEKRQALGSLSDASPQEPLGNKDPVLGLMPGSRKSEILFNLLSQLEAAQAVKLNHPELQVRLLRAPSLDEKWLTAQVPEAFRSWVTLVSDAPTAMIDQCDALLVASGTATLQVALCGKPMVVMYKMNGLTAFFAKRLVNAVDYFCIVNLIAGREIVPEYFQQEANTANLSRSLELSLFDPNYRSKAVAELLAVHQELGDQGASKNVVEFLMKKFGLHA